MQNKKSLYAIAILTLIASVVVGIYEKTKKPETILINNPHPENTVNDASSSTPLVTPVSTSTLVGLDLRQPLPISYTLFKHPKTYINEYVGFAFDYEEGTMKELSPVIKNSGVPDGQLGSVYYDKKGTYYLVDGFVGILKFPFLPYNPNGLSPDYALQDNFFSILIHSCGQNPANEIYMEENIVKGCYAQDVQKYDQLKNRYFASITDISQLKGDGPVSGEASYNGTKYSWNEYTPDLSFEFYAKINTGSSTQDQLLLQDLFKTRATFRLLN